jgi:hypothetical protein
MSLALKRYQLKERRISGPSRDLYDSLDDISHDILSTALSGDTAEVESLLKSVDEFKEQIITSFKHTIEEKPFERVKDVDYDVEGTIKKLRASGKLPSVVGEKALSLAEELMDVFGKGGDFNDDDKRRDMLDYVAIILVESMDNWYLQATRSDTTKNYEELLRVLSEYSRFVTTLRDIYKE